MKSSTTLEAVLKKDRYILVTGLLLLSALTWYYIIYFYQHMYPMNMDALLFAMPMTAKSTFVDYTLLFLMWFVMMVAMMTPSVAPLILVFPMVNRKRKERQSPFVTSNYFLAGYFIIWIVFSLLATILQWVF